MTQRPETIPPEAKQAIHEALLAWGAWHLSGAKRVGRVPANIGYPGASAFCRVGETTETRRFRNKPGRPVVYGSETRSHRDSGFKTFWAVPSKAEAIESLVGALTQPQRIAVWKVYRRGVKAADLHANEKRHLTWAFKVIWRECEGK